MSASRRNNDKENHPPGRRSTNLLSDYLPTSILPQENVSKTKKPKKKNNSKKIAKTPREYDDIETPYPGFQINLTDYLFTTFLTQFILTKEQLSECGYPISNTNDKALFFCNNPWSKRRQDFGQSPSSTSATSTTESSPTAAKQEPEGIERNCSRCFSQFYILDDKYVKEEKCVHHWGKVVLNKETDTREFTCCLGSVFSPGCTTAPRHVWSGVTFGVNGPFNGFVRTYSQPETSSVYSIDCEMIYTISGMEVIKVSLVGTHGGCVYDSFIRPENKVIDYNSRFSGIIEKDMEDDSKVKSLSQVQQDLLGLIGSDTILIGHGLENDLRGLKIIHKRIVDTAVVFKHAKGFPYRRSLKELVETFLKKEVESGHEGHDSLVDARRCMALMIHKVRTDFMMPMFWLKGM